MCDLCTASNKEWEEEGFYGLICNGCNVPMIVLVEHKNTLAKDEKKVVERLRQKYYPDSKYRGWGMRTIPQHWHEHFI